MNKYLKITMNDKNELRTNINISIGSLGITNIKDINVKIDTGCPYTSIPIQKLGFSKEQAYIMKQNDSADINIQKQISYGINDTTEDRKEAKRLFRNKKYMDLKQVTFIHHDLRLDFTGIEFYKPSVKISYDRTGNILIGMDILKDWDIHMGTIDTEETILLGCPKDQINDEYLQELENTFNIVTNANV